MQKITLNRHENGILKGKNMKTMFFVILAMLVTVSVSAGSKKNAPPPVTVEVGTVAQAMATKGDKTITRVIVNPNLAPVVPIASLRNTNIFDYTKQYSTNRFVEQGGQKMIEVSSQNVTAYFARGINSSFTSTIPGGTGDNWYKAPAQDAPYSKDAEIAAMQLQQQQNVVYSAPVNYAAGYAPTYSSSYVGSSYGSAGYTEKVRFHPWGTTYSYWGTPGYTSYGNYGGYGGNYGDGRYYGPYSVYTTTTRDYGLAVGAVGTTYRY